MRGYVLAGGGSTRFGSDKALAEIAGQPMLLRMIKLLSDSVASDVRVVGAASQYGKFAVPCVKDRWPGEGPLGGILTALLDTQPGSGRAWCMVLSCDMPFLNAEWVKYLRERSLSSDALVVIPRSTHGLEPLCACWRTDCAPALQARFDAGTRKVTEALKPLTLEVLDQKDWKRFDSGGRLFWNMNTPSEYEEARRILDAGQR
jgi:molybdopterin-guanine dinucleotide biosynthesis protein A